MNLNDLMQYSQAGTQFSATAPRPPAAKKPNQIEDSFEKMMGKSSARMGGYGEVGSLGGRMGELEKASMRLGETAYQRDLGMQQFRGGQEFGLQQLRGEQETGLQQLRGGQEMSLQGLRGFQERGLQQMRGSQETGLQRLRGSQEMGLQKLRGGQEMGLQRLRGTQESSILSQQQKYNIASEARQLENQLMQFAGKPKTPENVAAYNALRNRISGLNSQLR
jgi:hypothetical protein